MKTKTVNHITREIITETITELWAAQQLLSSATELQTLPEIKKIETEENKDIFDAKGKINEAEEILNYIINNLEY